MTRGDSYAPLHFEISSLKGIKILGPRFDTFFLAACRNAISISVSLEIFTCYLDAKFFVGHHKF